MKSILVLTSTLSGQRFCVAQLKLPVKAVILNDGALGMSSLSRNPKVLTTERLSTMVRFLLMPWSCGQSPPSLSDGEGLLALHGKRRS
jgi:hypothetical protein